VVVIVFNQPTTDPKILQLTLKKLIVKNKSEKIWKFDSLSIMKRKVQQ
jgi:hypothetical protein